MKTGKTWKLSLLFLSIGAYLSFVLSQKPDVSIEALIDPETRLKAYHAMWARTKSSNKHDFYKPLLRYKTFESKTNEIRLVKMPQKDAPDSPLYLILLDRQSYVGYPTPPWSSWGDAKDFSNWKAWFAKSSHSVMSPPLEQTNSDPIKSKFVVSLYASDGTLLDGTEPRPFTGNNVTEIGEIIYDINRDGWVERVASHNIGFSDSKIGGTVVTVRRINPETELLFSAMINVKNRESDPAITDTWSYQCVDTNNDGRLELQIGPETGSGINAAVTFFWNSKSQTFESPSGTIGPHFVVTTGKGNWRETWKVLDEIKKSGKLRYPFDN